MTGMDYLRKVTRDDMDLLFQWANDPVVRANAFSTEQIPYENHQKWFTARMKDPDTAMYLYLQDDVPVGQIRLDIADKEAEIDYSIAPEYRGKGYGKKMLLHLETVVRESLPHIAVLLGKVKLENQSSRHAFLKAGFQETPSMEEMNYILYKKKIQNK